MLEMADRNRLLQTMNNDCFPMSLYNEYLPTENAQSIQDVYRQPQIPVSSANVNGFSMTDREGRGQGAPPFQRSNIPHPPQQNVRRQQPSSYVAQNRTNLPHQGLQYQILAQNEHVVPGQTVQGYQLSVPLGMGLQNQKLQENPYASLSNLSYGQQFLAQGQRSGSQTPQPQQLQHMYPAAGYPQLQRAPSAHPSPMSGHVNNATNYGYGSSPQLLHTSPQSDYPQQPPKRRLQEGQSPPAKRVRASHQASLVSTNATPQAMSHHGHPIQYGQAGTIQLQRVPSSPYHSSPILKNNRTDTTAPKRTGANLQDYPDFLAAEIYASPSNAVQASRTPRRASPQLQRPQPRVTRSPKRPVAPSINTSMTSVDLERVKMLKSGFLKTPNQQKKPRTAGREATAVANQSSRIRQRSESTASAVPSPIPSAGSLVQQPTQRPESVTFTNVVPNSTPQLHQQEVYGGVPVSQTKAHYQRAPALAPQTPSPRLPLASQTLRQPRVLNLAHQQRRPPIQHKIPTPESPVANQTLRRPNVPHPTQQRKSPAPSSISQRPQPSRPVLAPGSVNRPSSQAPVNGKTAPEAGRAQLPSPPAVLNPGEKEWATYRVDENGTRYPKSRPPPQGTYYTATNSRFSLEARDYSDPRDFHAPTATDRMHVWTALGPTRDSYFKITGIKLDRRDMCCLSMGYHAAWDEIKRNVISWAFENYGPDEAPETKSGTSRHGVGSIQMRWVPDRELPGYSRIDVQVAGMKVTGSTGIEAARRAQEAKKFFKDGQMVFDVEKKLFKLKRWYGMIDGYVYSPNWTGERRTNRAGVQLQNPDAFSCDNCRESGRLCYGHKEHVNQKCEPCQDFQVVCSKEDILDQPAKGKSVQRPGIERGLAFGDDLRHKLQWLAAQRNGNGSFDPAAVTRNLPGMKPVRKQANSKFSWNN